MNIAIILAVVIVVGVVGYFLVTRSKTAAPIPMDQRSPVQVVQAPGDTKAAIDDAAAKAMQSERIRSLVGSGLTSPARLSLVTG